MSGSPRFSLDSTDARKIAKGALIAVIGAVLGYAATEMVPQLENSGCELAVLGAVVVNALWKWWRDNAPQP